MQEFVLLQNILPIMLALCSMLSGTYYAHNYASIIGGSLMKYPSTHFAFFIDPLNMAILNLLSTIGSLQLQCFRRYSEMAFYKKGVVNLGHFAPDRAFGTNHRLFLGVMQISVYRTIDLSFPKLSAYKLKPGPPLMVTVTQNSHKLHSYKYSFHHRILYYCKNNFKTRE